MPSDATNRATTQEWRELGFFYDRDDRARVWKLTGSRSGLLRFRDLLLSYVADPCNALEAEHEHYGPYAYLEVMTLPRGGVSFPRKPATLAPYPYLEVRPCPVAVSEAPEFPGPLKNLGRTANWVVIKPGHWPSHN